MNDPRIARMLSILTDHVLSTIITPEDGDWNEMMERGCESLFSYLRNSDAWSNDATITKEIGTSDQFGAVMLENLLVLREDATAGLTVSRFSAKGRKYATLELGQVDADFSFAVFQPASAKEWKLAVKAIKNYGGSDEPQENIEAPATDVKDTYFASTEDAFNAIFNQSSNQNAKGAPCDNCGRVH